MYWREVGTVCAEIELLDALRRPYKDYEKRNVVVNIKGVKRNEFYQAQAQGMKPELCVEVSGADYEGAGHF